MSGADPGEGVGVSPGERVGADDSASADPSEGATAGAAVNAAANPSEGPAVAPVRRRGPLDAMAAVIVAFVPGAAVVVATFFYYQQAVDHQFALVGSVCGSEAGRVQEELGRVLDQRAVAMERLAADRGQSPEGPAAWQTGATALAAGPFELRAVLEYDSTLVLGRIVPAEARLVSALDPRDDEMRRTALRVATSTLGREAVTVTTAPLGSGERQLLVCAPVLRGGRRIGWIVGVMRVHDVFDAALQRTLHDGFTVGVLEGPALIHGASMEDAGPGGLYARQSTLIRGPLIWAVVVWPGDDLARDLDSRAPVALFVAGMLLAFFVSASLFMWREQRLNSGA